jgi:hypothetical protein
MNADPEFALRSRKRCAPVECNNSDGCWVKTGAREAIDLRYGTTCIICNGKILIGNWVPPAFEKMGKSK